MRKTSTNNTRRRGISVKGGGGKGGGGGEGRREGERRREEERRGEEVNTHHVFTSIFTVSM